MRRFKVSAGRSSICRLSVGLVAVAAMVSPVGLVSSAQAAVAPASPSASASSTATAVRIPRIRMTPQTAHPFQSVTVSGKLPWLGSRTLWLQRKVGTQWVRTGFKVKTTRTGYYAFRISASGTGVYPVRLLAPRVVIGGRVRGRFVTGSRTLTVIPRAAAPATPYYGALNVTAP